jgi:hypothetical protein
VAFIAAQRRPSTKEASGSGAVFGQEGAGSAQEKFEQPIILEVFSWAVF